MDAGESTGRRGELLVNLRHGLRKSSELAETLIGNPDVEDEARTLLRRLRAIADELDTMQRFRFQTRLNTDDRLWGSATKSRH